MNTQEIAKYLIKEFAFIIMSAPFLPHRTSVYKCICVINHVMPFIRDEKHWEEIKKLIKDENQQ